MTNAIATYTAVYAAYLETITVGGCKKIALSFAVSDMMNQVKHLSQKAAIATILDEAEYLAEKVVA